MTWEELIDRLLTIMKANGYPKEWVINQVELAGHPPKQIWREIAKALNYSQYWADWRYLPGHETEEPDFGAIDWEKFPVPPIPKPILRKQDIA
jgi:hypothetical protein